MWWLGVALFTPSVLLWLVAIALFYEGMWECAFDWEGARGLYLPMFAAVVGFAVPLLCLRCLRSSSWRVTGRVFAGYLAVMLIWGIIDVRQQHYQIGGHEYPGIVIDGHSHYFHVYLTWYFLPYKWIEQGVGG
jgi:hypothetical protein